jgi:hypothetical protein
MNTTLSHSALQEHQPERELAVRRLPVRRVGLLDRLALRLGLALVTWGRRPRRERRSRELSREQRMLLRENDRARAERELHQQLAAQLSLPHR